MKKTPSRFGFTMIEMLTVVAIVTVLAAMTLTAVMKVRQYAWRTQAKETCGQLVAAWTKHMTDFRHFPSNSASIVEMDAEAIATLNTLSRYNQYTEYMEFSEKEKAEGLKDRWGHLFQVALDAGVGLRDSGDAYDGQVTAGAHGNIRKPVAAWSLGPDGQDGTDDDIVSW